MRFSIFSRIGLGSSHKKDKAYSYIKGLLGTSPGNINLYRLAFTHKSSTDGGENHLSYERLEFLGDAILDSIISDILYKRFPYKSEGELTQFRSNVVKRASLNKMAKGLGLDKMLITGPNANVSIRMYGDMLEALVGAIYLDKGYRFTFHFVRKKVLDRLLSDEEVTQEQNFKSKLLEWGQRYRHQVVFSEEQDESDDVGFISRVTINGEVKAQGKGRTKKESHNDVARQALKDLGLLP